MKDKFFAFLDALDSQEFCEFLDVLYSDERALLVAEKVNQWDATEAKFWDFYCKP